MTDHFGVVLDVLMTKAKNSLTAKELWNYYNGNLSYNQFARELRLRVHKLRLNGVFIGSGNKGYYMVKTKEEAYIVYNKLKKAMKSYIELVKAIEVMLPRFESKLIGD